MNLRITNCLMTSSIVCLLLTADVFALPQTETQISFKNDIQPIFESHCLRCHGPETEEAFRIDEKDAAMDYIAPGEPEESEIYTYLISDDEDEMMPPPDEGGPLDDADVQLVKLWITQGASWPDNLKWKLPVDSETDAVADTSQQDEKTAVQPTEPNIWRAIGSLHPAVIHLPIGLLLASGLFALLSLRGSFVMSDCSYYCLWLGTLGAIAACVTGWWFAPMENPDWRVKSFDNLINMDTKIFWHRSSGLIVTIAAFLICLFAAGARNRNPDDGVLWKLGAMLLAVGIGYVGYEGGELTWNRNGKHYRDLNEVFDKYVPIFSTDGEAKPGSSAKPAPSTKPAEPKTGTDGSAAAESPVTGKTSTETSAPKGSKPKPELQK